MTPVPSHLLRFHFVGCAKEVSNLNHRRFFFIPLVSRVVRSQSSCSPYQNILVRASLGHMFMWWILESHHASDSPIRCRKHLGLIGMVSSSRQVHRCKPYPEYVECYAQVVKELKERDSHDKIQGVKTER